MHHLGLLAVQLQLQRRAHRAGQRGEGGGQCGRGLWQRRRRGSGTTSTTGSGGGTGGSSGTRGGGRGGGPLHGRPDGGVGGHGVQLADAGLQLAQALVQLVGFVAGQLQALGLQPLQTQLHAHDEVQQQVQVLVGAGALMLMDLLLLNLVVDT